MAAAAAAESYVVVHNVAKRHNVGTLARSATAFGVKEVIVVGRRDFNSFGSHGSTSHLSFRHFSSLLLARSFLKERGCDICGVEIREGAVDVCRQPFQRSTAFLVGNEGTGLSEKECEICDFFVYIPQYGSGTASLNVTVAASIVLHHFAVGRGNRVASPGFRGWKMPVGFPGSPSYHDLGSPGYREDVMVEDSPRRGAIDDCSVGLESDSFSSASTSNSECGSCPKDSNNKDPWRSFIRTLKKGPAVRFHTFPPKNVPKLAWRKILRTRGELGPDLASGLDMEWSYFKPSWKNFSLDELQEATNNFSQENLIGEGGCAKVYKGLLLNGQHVAIKRLTRGTPEQMTADFLSELGIIVHTDHPNIAKLIGYGVEGGMHIVLHLSPHGSLATFLYGSKDKLNWNTRFKVALGTAAGLMYLHEDCQRRIIHKDIKAANVLLSEDFEPQISDFGLAKWLPGQWTHHTVSQIEGTFGYLPPEYFMHGIVNEKTDVYAYGVLLLELITGRQALDSTQKSLVMWAKPLLATNSVKAIVDPSLNGAYDSAEMDRIVLAASLCISQSSAQRPEMSRVVRILKGEECCSEQEKKHRRPSLQRTYSEELYAAEEYNTTKYLSDLEKYTQIVLGKSTAEL